VKSGPKFDTKNRVFDPSLRRQKLCRRSPGGNTRNRLRIMPSVP